MVGVEQWAEIRRLLFVRGLSVREISRRTGLHRDTIRSKPGATAESAEPRVQSFVRDQSVMRAPVPRAAADGLIGSTGSE